MKQTNIFSHLLPLVVALFGILSIGVSAFAQDDGARAYWNTRAGTQMTSFQYLPMNIGTSGSKAFAPDKYIYPNSHIEANVFLGTWARHLTLFNRASALAINVIGGSVNASVDASISSDFLPPGIAPDISFSQSSAGFADPSAQLVVNLFGTPALKSNVDLLNYEPTITLDAAVMVAFPLGKYDSDKLLNMGLNRWYGRAALPIKYHFGVFAPGYMSSLELIPSVWLFDDNTDFIGKTLKNDPLFSLEAHLTHDLAPSIFASLDMLYQNGFQTKVDGMEVGDKLDIGILGFTLNYNVTENVMIRTEFTSNVFGDENIETSVGRLQFVYAWSTSNVNSKKLMQGH
jgi:hypothetical protein